MARLVYAAFAPGARLCYQAGMGKFFAPNITRWGRLVRALWGLGCFGLAVALFSHSHLAGVVLAVAGVFALFEAARGWCVMRACGVKTKL